MRNGNKVVLITGCSTGIGRDLALEFFRKGYRVFATARKLSAIEDLKKKGMDVLALDITDANSINKAIKQIIDQAGGIHVLVNNAGYNQVGPVAEFDIEDLRNQFETNVIGQIAITQAVVPNMVANKYGRIINIGSVMGDMTTPFAGPYCATKAALHSLTDVLRMELKPFGIEVTSVRPGGVVSSLSSKASALLEKYDKPCSLYHKVAEYIYNRATISQVNAMSASDFARKLVKSLDSKKAPYFIRLGTNSRAFLLTRILPTRIIDLIMSKKFGLDKL